LAVIALVLFMTADGIAQGHEWLLGVWSGEGVIGLNTASVTLTFRNEGADLKRTWAVEGRLFKAAAEGSVITSDTSSAELAGKYTSHTNPAYIGSGVKVSLKGSPSAPARPGIGEYGNRAFTLALTKNK
jgi:hypothetical protein